MRPLEPPRRLEVAVEVVERQQLDVELGLAGSLARVRTGGGCREGRCRERCDAGACDRDAGYAAGGTGHVFPLLIGGDRCPRASSREGSPGGSQLGVVGKRLETVGAPPRLDDRRRGAGAAPVVESRYVSAHRHRARPGAPAHRRRGGGRARPRGRRRAGTTGLPRSRSSSASRPARATQEGVAHLLALDGTGSVVG